MDTLAHYLWTVPLYWQHPKRWWLGIVGAAPDLLSFGPHIAASVLMGGLQGRPSVHSIPQYVFSMYDVTHSFVVFAIVFLAIFLWRREWALLTLGWPLHILIDIPTHTDAFFPTPFLWPISSFTVSGLSWGTGWFFLSTYVGLAIVYGTLLWRRIEHVKSRR